MSFSNEKKIPYHCSSGMMLLLPGFEFDEVICYSDSLDKWLTIRQIKRFRSLHLESMFIQVRLFDWQIT